MGILGKLLGQSNIKLLTTNITVDEDLNYNILFKKEHEQLKTPEYIRLPLHYYAKLMYNFGGSDAQSSQSADIMMNYVRHLCLQDITKHTDVLQLIEADDVASIVTFRVSNNPKLFSATLYYIDQLNRRIKTNVPMRAYHQQAVYSFFVLVQATLKRLGDIEISMLFEKLGLLTRMYQSGEDYSSLKTLNYLPNKVFFG